MEQVSRYNDLAIEVNGQVLNALKIHQSICNTTGSSSNCSCQGVEKQFSTGTFMFLIGHPEQMINKTLFKEMRQERYQSLLTHLVIDEAHCVEKWGTDFRKGFAKLRELRSILPKAKVLALTGTASTETQKSIKVTILMKDAVTFQSCIARTNIKLFVKRRPNYKDGSEESFLVYITASIYQ
ncbi:recQ [Mytilus coruscus]|uniref:DNA 3'-5' helicase n=1 Tax=Mytilus coruscus TaxID=42192 RepID=A0A6J8BLJ6_MYTCO|nr:recQ [Mytilus coruscus]